MNWRHVDQDEILMNAYKEHGQLIVAFDFDNTIFDYHQKGIDYEEVISLLAECSFLGFCMVLFTCEEHQTQLEIKMQWCKSRAIIVDYINTSPVKPDAAKPYCNILLDDKAGLSESYDRLSRFLQKIK